MLSRVAASLYVAGQQLERADNLARILVVHSDLSLDNRQRDRNAFWSRYSRLAGLPEPATPNRATAVEMTIAGDGRRSIRASLAAARRAANSVRPSLSTEVYERINSLYWQVDQRGSVDVHSLLMTVQLAVHTITGLVEDSMPHDEPRDFVRLGRFVERAGNGIRLVSTKWHELSRDPDDELEWAAVLKCTWSFEAHQMERSGVVDGPGVAQSVLLDGRLPRSVAFSVQEALQSVVRIDRPGGRRSLAQRALIEAAACCAAGAAGADVGVLLDGNRLEGLLERAERAIRDTYFQPVRVASTSHGDGTTQPQPQQQQ